MRFLVLILFVSSAALCGCARGVSGAAPVGATRAVLASHSGVQAPLPRPAAKPGHGEVAVQRALADLTNPEFRVRTQAMRTLVAGGEASLDGLGRSSQTRLPGPAGLSTPVAAPVIEAILRVVPEERLAVHLRSPHAAVRAAAAQEIGARGRWGAIADLIDSLEDPDAGVRTAAVASLRRLTRRFEGFHPHASVGSRQVATQRWRQWWRQVGRLAPPVQPALPDDAI